MRTHPALLRTMSRVLLPFGLGYFLSYLFRTVNAVIGPDVAKTLGLGTAEIGLVTSAYFVTFAAFQLPLGVLLDRYGPRRVEAALLVVAAAGAVVFSQAASTGTLALGRGLIGLGVSACLMGAMKANVQSWPPERWAVANGTTLAMGGLGALVATAPVSAALAYTDWRGLFLLLAAATLAAAALIFFVVPKSSSNPSAESWREAFRGAFAAFRGPAFLRVAPLAALSQATMLSYHGLWSAAWLRDIDGLDRHQVGTAMALITAGLVLGTFGIGIVADRLARAGIQTLTVAVTGSGLYLLVQLGLVLQVPVSGTVMWAAFVLLGTSGSLYFTVLAHSFPRHLSGRVSTALNTVMFTTAFLLQWLVGVLLGSSPVDGKAPAASHAGILAIILVMEAAALAWFFVRAPRPT